MIHCSSDIHVCTFIYNDTLIDEVSQAIGLFVVEPGAVSAHAMHVQSLWSVMCVFILLAFGHGGDEEEGSAKLMI